MPGFFDDFRKFTAYDWLMHLFGIPFSTGPGFYGPFWFIRELLIFNILSFALVPAVKKDTGLPADPRYDSSLFFAAYEPDSVFNTVFPDGNVFRYKEKHPDPESPNPLDRSICCSVYSSRCPYGRAAKTYFDFSDGCLNNHDIGKTDRAEQYQEIRQDRHTLQFPDLCHA